MLIYGPALKISPEDRGITCQVGRMASISGDIPRRGIEAFMLYLYCTPRPNEPGLDWANYRLDLIYQQQGKTEQAIGQYEKAIVINSGQKEAKKGIEVYSAVIDPVRICLAFVSVGCIRPNTSECSQFCLRRHSSSSRISVRPSAQYALPCVTAPGWQ